ncbi:MAG: response regulator [Sandaracinus sp.]|nr:response regulator [Sandaracinus sp.]MCB9618636.1 response regulator [Sandaracinus sp.]MCB9632569.1 response regulator [Sandaracinus sp.]
MSEEKKQLGKILLKQRLVTPDELETLLQEQKTHPGSRLASTVERAGKVSSKELLKALSEQHGLPGIDLAQVVVPTENLRWIPADVAKRHSILPVLVKDDRIFLAMADPRDRRVIDEIEFVTGRRVFPYVALHDLLQEVIEEAYRLLDKGESHYVGPQVPADYLASLGIAPSPVEAAPPPSPAGVVVEEVAPNAHADLGRLEDDELGLRELEHRARDGEPFHSQVAPLPTRPRDTSGQPKVLVVDDEDDIRKLLTRVLAQKGYVVVEASKGLEALQKVRDEQPDVILLDAMLPEVHGFDICRRIKGSKRYGHIPIVMVSAIYRGWRVAEDLKTSYGVDAFLEKPFKVADVLLHVERAIEGRRSEVPNEEDDVLSREASAALDAGMEAYRAGDLETAIARLREGIQIDPLSFQLHYHLGLLCGRRDDLFEAIHELETAVDLQPRNFSALKNLAVLYQRAGFKHKAIEMWERALAAAPDDETRQGIKDHLMTLL